MAAMRRWAGLIAALLLAGVGVTLLSGGGRLLGGLLLGVGVGAAIWQARKLYVSRPDPYDLSRLFDTPPVEDQPEEEFVDANDVPFCHFCGHAVSAPFARCPSCGNPVR